MRLLALTTVMAFMAGLFFAGTAFSELQKEQVQIKISGLSPVITQEHMRNESKFQISLNLLNAAQVRRLQQQLKDNGIDPGPVDGVAGPLTKQGVQVLQQQQGLAATGNLNEQTLNALEIETEEFMGLAPAFE